MHASLRYIHTDIHVHVMRCLLLTVCSQTCDPVFVVVLCVASVTMYLLNVDCVQPSVTVCLLLTLCILYDHSFSVDSERQFDHVFVVDIVHPV